MTDHQIKTFLSELFNSEQNSSTLSLDLHERLTCLSQWAHVGTFSTSIIHSIASPIQVLQVALVELENTLEHSEKSDSGSEIQSSLELMKKACNQIMQDIRVARKISRSKKFDLCPFQIGDLIQKSISLSRVFVEPKVKIQKGSIESARVNASESHFYQVILALVKNAMEALESTTNGVIQISCIKSEDFASIHIINNGPEIPGDVKEHMFEPFFSTRDGCENGGLGLTIARSIARRHGGNVEFISDSGNCFEFSLPLGKSRTA